MHGLARRRDLGIHEDGPGDGSGVRIAGILVAPEDDDAQRHIDPRCGEPYSVAGLHGLEHILDQGRERVIVERTSDTGAPDVKHTAPAASPGSRPGSLETDPPPSDR